MIAAAGITVQVRLPPPTHPPTHPPFPKRTAAHSNSSSSTPSPPSLQQLIRTASFSSISPSVTHPPTHPPFPQEKFITNGLPEFEFHRFALSDVYNFFF